MTPVMALGSVTSFLRLKDVTSTCKRLRHSQTFCGIFQCNDGKLEETEGFKCVLRRKITTVTRS